LDKNLDPVIGMERVGLACARGTSEACVFRGTQLGTLICESSFLRDGMTCLWYNTVVIIETWKNSKLVLIAYHMLESSIGAFLEWSVKELSMTTDKS
jgi:hypothetical protein